MAEAIVITPTTGAEVLKDAILSVKNQTVEVDHLIVCDGEQFTDKTKQLTNKFKHKNLKTCYLPFNTGSNGFYGHRIMAAFSHLINHDYILFLDQDNWYEPTHVETLLKEVKQFSYDWAYSLRGVFDKNKNFICEDNCESLGRWPVWVNKDAYLIDTSSYIFSKLFLEKTGHLWHHGWGADRRFFHIIKNELKHFNFGCSGKYTLCYRLDGNEGSVNKEFFIEGNRKTLEAYNGNLPWQVTYS